MAEIEKVKRTGITVTLDIEKRRRFQVRLAERGEKMAVIIRRWIENYVLRGTP